MFWLYNMSDCRTRTQNYYNVPYVPYMRIDGNIIPSSYGQYETRIETESLIPSPLFMQLSGTFDRDSLRGVVSVRIVAEEAPGYTSLKLRIALTESGIYYNGIYGRDWHQSVFRDMFPGTNGLAITLNAGDDTTFAVSFTTPSPIVADSCELIAFVQSDQTGTGAKHIVQGAKIPVSDLRQPTGIVEIPSLPDNFTLSQNYPNPFNAETKINFQSAGGDVNLAVYNITGSLIKDLVNSSLEKGSYSVTWNGTDNSGNAVSSGIYFYRITDGKDVHTMRMTLLK